MISQFGEVVQKTDMGPVFKIPPLKTICGDLELLKIRKPDSERPERGDADFTIESYIDFKKECLSQQGFSLLTRSNMEMIELKDPSFNVLAYYSHPILKEVLNFK